MIALSIIFVMVNNYVGSDTFNTELEFSVINDDSVKKILNLNEKQWVKFNEINNHFINEKTKYKTLNRNENERMKKVMQLSKGVDSLIIKCSKIISNNELYIQHLQVKCMINIEDILSKKQKEIIRSYPIEFAGYYQHRKIK